jgi:plasmid stabilization system protein ParE
VSDHAKTTLGAHIKFMAQISPAAARDIKEQLLAAIRSLEEMPERFPFLEEEFVPRGKYHKIFVAQWYLILYQIKDRTVDVDCIVDCRQDYSRMIH